MRRLLLVAGVVLLLFLPALPAHAESAEWDLCSAYSGQYRVHYTININSLQISSFTAENITDYYGYMRIKKDGVVIFEMLTAPDSTQTETISGFKLNRVPATDHDDPNSVRIPKGVSIGCRFPAF